MFTEHLMSGLEKCGRRELGYETEDLTTLEAMSVLNAFGTSLGEEKTAGDEYLVDKVLRLTKEAAAPAALGPKPTATSGSSVGAKPTMGTAMRSGSSAPASSSPARAAKAYGSAMRSPVRSPVKAAPVKAAPRAASAPRATASPTRYSSRGGGGGGYTPPPRPRPTTVAPTATGISGAARALSPTQRVRAAIEQRARGGASQAVATPAATATPNLNPVAALRARLTGQAGAPAGPEPSRAVSVVQDKLAAPVRMTGYDTARQGGEGTWRTGTAVRGAAGSHTMSNLGKPPGVLPSVRGAQEVASAARLRAAGASVAPALKSAEGGGGGESGGGGFPLNYNLPAWAALPALIAGVGLGGHGLSKLLGRGARRGSALLAGGRPAVQRQVQEEAVENITKQLGNMSPGAARKAFQEVGRRSEIRSGLFGKPFREWGPKEWAMAGGAGLAVPIGAKAVGKVIHGDPETKKSLF